MLEEPRIPWRNWLTRPWATYLALREWRQHADYFEYIKVGLAEGQFHVMAEFYIERFELDMETILIPQNMRRARKYYKFKILKFFEDEGRPMFFCTGPKGMFLVPEMMLWKLFISNGSLEVLED